MKKVLITASGGHATAALAVIEELRKRNWEIFWVGARSAFEKHYFPTFESQILPGLDVPSWGIDTAKLHRGRPLASARSFLKLPQAFLQALSIIRKTSPSAVLSFGGYVSVPVCFSARLLGIPVLVHEQTTTSGFANRLVSRIARKVAISHKNSFSDFPKAKTVLTGNPVRRGIFKAAETREPSDKPLVYVTGGSRGSQVINEVVFSLLPELLEDSIVYHQTGSFDFKKARRIKKQLGKLGNSYFSFVSLEPPAVADIYKKATLVVSRAGANTVSELDVLGIPAVLIPIPWAEKDEQTKNARLLEDAGMAIVLPQSKLAGKTLLYSIKQILKNPDKYRKKKGYLLANPRAAERIAELVERVSYAKNS